MIFPLILLSSFRLIRNTDNCLVQQQPRSKLAHKNSYQSKVFLSTVLFNITDWKGQLFYQQPTLWLSIAERIGDDILKLPQFDVLIFIKNTILSTVCENSCHLVIQSFGNSVIWSFIHLVIWSYGHSVIQAVGHLVIRLDSLTNT